MIYEINVDAAQMVDHPLLEHVDVDDKFDLVVIVSDKLRKAATLMADFLYQADVAVVMDPRNIGDAYQLGKASRLFIDSSMPEKYKQRIVSELLDQGIEINLPSEEVLA